MEFQTDENDREKLLMTTQEQQQFDLPPEIALDDPDIVFYASRLLALGTDVAVRSRFDPNDPSFNPVYQIGQRDQAQRLVNLCRSMQDLPGMNAEDGFR